MQVNGVPVPDAEFAAVCEALQPCIAAMDDPPTEFELVTAAAMLWFRRRVVHGSDARLQRLAHGGKLRVRYRCAVDLHALSEAL